MLFLTELFAPLKLSYKALLKLSYMAHKLHGSLATLPSETELHGSLKLSCKALLKLSCRALSNLSYMAP